MLEIFETRNWENFKYFERSKSRAFHLTSFQSEKTSELKAVDFGTFQIKIQMLLDPGNFSMLPF